MQKKSKILQLLIIFSIILNFIIVKAETKILQWPDGKQACISLTYDDGSLNHFRMAVPMMNAREFNGTFFINTQTIEGSKYAPKFVGRPIMDILADCRENPTNKDNILERSSMIRYLAEIKKDPVLEDVDMYTIGSHLEHGRMEKAIQLVDKACKKLNNTSKFYTVTGVSASKTNKKLSWDRLAEIAEEGHEFANHTISHPHLSTLNEANILYEIEKCTEDIASHLGFKHTLSIECPYGIEDPRVLKYAYERFPFLRNRVKDPYIKEILRGDTTAPVSEKPYIHWQRGPLSDTSMETMKSWVNKSIANKVWLVLVFHGIEGIGWESLPQDMIANYFDYIKENEEHIWVATYQNAYKYMRERMETDIEEQKQDDKIVINLKNDLDNKIYNQLLTLETEIPPQWEAVKVIGNGQEQKINKLKNGIVRYTIKSEIKTLTIQRVK